MYSSTSAPKPRINKKTTITNFIREKCVRYIQIKCIFNLDALFPSRPLLSPFRIQLKYKNIVFFRPPDKHWLQKRMFCVIGSGSRATDFYPSLEMQKSQPAHVRWNIRDMHNCYCVVLKNLLLSLGFCTYLQLISIPRTLFSAAVCAVQYPNKGYYAIECFATNDSARFKWFGYGCRRMVFQELE